MHILQNPFAVVTDASSGIGYELAKQFAQHGFDLLIVSASDRIHDAAEEIAFYGESVTAVQTDLATHEGVHELLAAIESSMRPVDVAALNAGIGLGGRFVETDLADELRMVALNVTSTLHVTKCIVQDMVTRRSGRILFTTAIGSSMPHGAVYGATKSFVRSLAQNLREELKETGVTVTMLAETEKLDPAAAAKDGFEALMAGKGAETFDGNRSSQVHGFPETSKRGDPLGCSGVLRI